MGDVKVRVGADISGLRTGLQNANREVDSFGSRAGARLESFGRSLAAAFSIGAIINFTKSIFAMGGAIQDSADNLNLSTKALQGLGHAFAQGGASQQDFEKGMLKLNQNLDDARKGSGKARDAFDALGIKWADIATKSPEEILYIIADAMKKANGSTASLAAAFDLLGKSGVKLTGTLSTGSDAVKDLASKAKILTDQQIADLAKVGDKWDEITQKVKAYGAELILALGKGAKDGVGGHEDKLKDAAREAAEKAGLIPKQEKPLSVEELRKLYPKPQEPTPEDPRAVEAAKKQAEEMAKFDKLISEASDKEAKERLETERECLLEEIALARKAGEDRKKIEEDQIEHNRQQYHDWLVEKDRMDREDAANQRQRQVDSASEMITEREAEIDEELKPASQKRAEKRESDAREKAGRKIQRKKDEAEKVAKQNDVNRPDVFKKEDPREHWRKGGDRAKDSAGKKEKGPEQSPAEAMRSDIAEIKGHISTLVSKINVK